MSRAQEAVTALSLAGAGAVAAAWAGRAAGTLGAIAMGALVVLLLVVALGTTRSSTRW